MKYEPFDIKKIPSQGITLIEASAGTGKTSSIIFLYIRFILNIGTKKSYSKPLSINEILIVTFTESSKNELKKRLYKKICQLYHICKKKTKKNNELSEIIKDIKNFKKTINLLKKVKKNIDSIMIYTLHGFFRYILLEQKFLCKQKIYKKILSNIKKIQVESTKDFWRKCIYSINKKIVEMIIKKWKTPQQFFLYIYTLLNQKNIEFKYHFPKNANLNEKYNDIIKVIKKTKKIWEKKEKEIKNLIKNITLNNRIYNKKNLNIWYTQISVWSKNKTVDCSFPRILQYFQYHKIQKNKKLKDYTKYIFFKYIEKIFFTYNLFFEYFIYFSLKTISQIIENKKKEKNGLEFNDLNKIMWKQIKLKKSIIKQNILKKYTITIIDECQDIDDTQFNIFYSLYNKEKNKSLILIGDPKQSIYSFRGANIFWYLTFKKKIKKHFFLKKNFRSSENIVTGVNILFSQIKKPFIFKEVNFQPSSVYSGNKNFQFTVNNTKQPAFQFIFENKKIITKKEYYSWISKECANSIYNWLFHASKNKSFIELKNKKKRTLKPNDIAILIKNKYEASIIKKELEKKGIKTIYTSQKNNIFHTIETKEIICILDSIIDLSNELKFQRLLITQIFKKNIYDINLINQKKELYFSLLKKLKKYYIIWNTLGISKMMIEIIIDFNIQISSIDLKKNNINIQNIILLAEILEKKNKKIKNKFLLITWLKKKIVQNNTENNNENNKQKYNNTVDQKCIKIITIYKSKGLEYPIVWIPFFSNFQTKDNHIFFCKKKMKNIIDLKNKKNSYKLSIQEKLSEDIRLLYVALTRSILHCSIGMAVVKRKKMNKKIYTNFHKSSLGFLIQKGKKLSFDKLKKVIQNIKKNTEIFSINKPIKKSIKKTIIYKQKNFKKNTIINIRLLKKIKNPWTRISFSKIMQYNSLQKKNNIEINIENNKIIYPIKNTISSKINIYKFPPGREYGIYLHNILKKIKFSNTKNIREIINKLNFISLSKIWVNKLYHWICIFISSSLNKHKLKLNKLKEQEYKKEINFIIPIKKNIDINKFNRIIKNFDKISKKCKNIKFKKISGILTGIIDIIFLWKKKYYIIDYKSNWLGPNNSYYTQDNIKMEIIKYRYDIQYQIYSLAMHRFLKKKIKKYSYKTHFGGVFYLFLRAFDDQKNSGIYFIKPSYLLINNLDNLFSGKFHDLKK
ncbi:RecBCD enzyme subunit RecB [Buchnera aphidicola (Cinara piceae)]|uniref:RecBCD enzyme subunit RecB n=1 Tax=Buchnera aphidicola (Cinara piceae) TaxID=1660043 RepID=A0A803FU76_9GAMM|nr:exodeoxyribonuclease V subunit beta [Buchnera aphidicola]VFP88586.1 RecBCD enzyme subunit RecB [Buchnera aphidicola (Cinara piceae)]